MLKLGRNEMVTQLREYMYSLFCGFDPQHPGNRWRLLGPLWMMERLNATELLDVLLEALRQDAHFIYDYVLQTEDYVAASIYQLGRKHPDRISPHTPSA